MGAGRGAAVGVVAKGVDVEATLGVGVIAGDVVGDGGRGTLRGLLEDDGAGDLGVSSEDGDCDSRLAQCLGDESQLGVAASMWLSRDTLAPPLSSKRASRQG